MTSKVEPGMTLARRGKAIALPPLIVRVKSYLYAEKKQIEDPDNSKFVIRADLWLVTGRNKDYHPLCQIDPDAKEIRTKSGKQLIKASNIETVIEMVLQSLETE